MDSLLDTAPCGFVSFTDDGTIFMVNATLLDLLGYQREELQGQHFETILPIASRIFYQTHFFPSLKMQGKLDELYFSLRSKSGIYLPMLINARRQEHAGFITNDCIFITIHKRNEYEDEILRAKKAAEEAIRAKEQANMELAETNALLKAKQLELLQLNNKLEVMATTDVLTGLKNHRSFQDYLTLEINKAAENSTKLSLLLIDIDYFKRINDTFGHLVGDRYLRGIAHLLQQCSTGLGVAARYGGEEFAVILPNMGLVEAVNTAEKFRATIEADPWVEVAVTVSIGVSTLSAKISDKYSLLATADKALYASKARGRNCVTHGCDLMNE